MTYLNQLIQENQELWDAAASHEFTKSMIEEKLSEECIKLHISQQGLMAMEGIRALLNRTMAIVHPSDKYIANMTQHLQSLQYGGSQFNCLMGALKMMDVDDISQLQYMPATEALCNYFFKIGVVGTVHEKVLAITVFTELIRYRCNTFMKYGSVQNHPVFGKWHSQRQADLIGPQLDYLREFLDETIATTPICRDTDKHVFRKVLQWIILSDSAIIHRGVFEWPTISSGRSRNA